MFTSFDFDGLLPKSLERTVKNSFQGAKRVLGNSLFIVDFKLHGICSSMDQKFSEIRGEEGGDEVAEV